MRYPAIIKVAMVLALIGLISSQTLSQAAPPAKAKNAIASTVTPGDITFSCKKASNDTKNFTSSNSAGTEPRSTMIKGSGNLQSILLDIDNRIGRMDEFVFQNINKQKTCEYTLEYKGKVSIENVLEVIGKQIGFTYQVKEKKTKTIYEVDFSHLNKALISSHPQTVATVSSKPYPNCKITKTATGFVFQNARPSDITSQIAEYYKIAVLNYPTTEGSIDTFKEVIIPTPASLDKGLEILKANTGIEFKPKKIQADTIVIIGKKIQ